MQSKSLLIAIAAFAVTATGVHAYGGTAVLERAGLSEVQISAFEAAREFRAAGDLDAARDVLVEAGIDEDTLRSVHQAAHAVRQSMRTALQAGDYEAFKEVIADSPLADIITTEADFVQFKEAHALRTAGEWEDAKEILDELGVEPNQRHGYHKAFHRHPLKELNEEQRAALQVARQANDRATMQAILDEAGIMMPSRSHRAW